jgi:AcrR family transcriptional regulator
LGPGAPRRATITAGSTAAYRRVPARSTGKPQVSGPHRLGRDAYFTAAFALLGAEGPEALTIAALCKRLRVTKGSFYHHFSGMPQFTESLLRHWEDEHAAILEEVAALSDPARRFEITAERVHALPHDAEAALRAWGYREPMVGAAVARIDRARAQNYAGTLALVIDDPERCWLLAHMGMAVIIGLQMFERPMDPERFLRVGLEWAHTNIGLTMVAEADEHGALRVRVTGLPNGHRVRNS